MTTADAQRTAAEAWRARIEWTLNRPVVVELRFAGAFYPAEAYHQDCYRKL